MKFIYKKAETYSQEDLDGILEQHFKFSTKQYANYVSPEDVQRLKDELTPLKVEKRNSHITGLVKDLTDSDKINDAILLANISEDDTDEDITSKVSKVIEERNYLQKTVVDDKESIKKKPIPKPEPEKTYRFAGKN